jgi:NAD dependent epimerase/dehydratase family enzyme
MLLTGQRVVPAHALARGFRFRFPTIDAALSDLFAQR